MRHQARENTLDQSRRICHPASRPTQESIPFCMENVDRNRIDGRAFPFYYATWASWHTLLHNNQGDLVIKSNDI